MILKVSPAVSSRSSAIFLPITTGGLFSLSSGFTKAARSPWQTSKSFAKDLFLTKISFSRARISIPLRPFFPAARAEISTSGYTPVTPRTAQASSAYFLKAEADCTLLILGATYACMCDEESPTIRSVMPSIMPLVIEVTTTSGTRLRPIQRTAPKRLLRAIDFFSALGNMRLPANFSDQPVFILIFPQLCVTVCRRFQQASYRVLPG